MFISVLRITMHLPLSRSLKDKRRVLNSIKDKLKNKFNVSVAEVSDLDLWQRSTIGVAVVGNDIIVTDSILESVNQFIHSVAECEVIDVKKETMSFNDYV